MKKTLLAAFAFLAVFHTAIAKDLLLRQDAPAKDWESQYFPIGNGSLGAMLNGGVEVDELQLIRCGAATATRRKTPIPTRITRKWAAICRSAR